LFFPILRQGPGIRSTVCVRLLVRFYDPRRHVIVTSDVFLTGRRSKHGLRRVSFSFKRDERGLVCDLGYGLMRTEFLHIEERGGVART
jgi:hypothetical protein